MSRPDNAEPKFPHDERVFLNTLHRLLQTRGKPKSVGALENLAAALLASGKCNIEYLRHEDYDGGCDGFHLIVCLSVDDYARVPADAKERDELRLVIHLAANELLPQDGVGIFKVSLAPLVSVGDLRVVADVNNQGRAHSQNVAGIIEDGLRFRSPNEVNLYRALRKLDVTFAPLPVFLKMQRRIEPDFVLMKDGIVLVVEVDGNTTHRESPVEADERLGMFKYEGVFTERVRAQECATETLAQQLAQRLLAVMAKHRKNR